MKALATLVRVREHELDERRRRLALRQSELDRIEEAIAALDRATAQEVDAAPADILGRLTLTTYIEAQCRRRANLDWRRSAAAKARDDAANAVAAAFQDFKRLDLALAERRAAEAAAREKAQADALDELALQRAVSGDRASI